MTKKIYKSAMGKTVDMGALILQNEQVRAVGNMGVNAAGDIVDGNNQVIDQRNRQVQRQYKKQTNESLTNPNKNDH
jgi:glycine cleavage system H lipoate-binding protein